MNARGFTLIEFMIIVAIVLILTMTFVSTWLKPPQSCIDFGYPNTRTTREGQYCLRRVNGTDEIVLLRDLIDRDRQRIER